LHFRHLTSCSCRICMACHCSALIRATYSRTSSLAPSHMMTPGKPGLL
jgi:hypothetical protein